jgi:murein DD-endopeptidase MepM/ murein hydrolase activator NlpD
VFIRHDDDKLGRYFHLTQGGALVEPGRQVLAGDVIGLSGDSGRSFAPHLHFDVTPCATILGCVSLPVMLWNTRPHPNGLVEGEVLPRTVAAPPPARGSGCAPALRLE